MARTLATQLSNMNRRLTALLELSQQLASKHDPTALLQACCDAACAIIGARQASILMVDDAGQPSHEPIYASLQGSAEPAGLRLDPQLLAQLGAVDGPARLSGGAAERGHGGGPLGVPIVSATQRYGVLVLGEKLDGSAFGAEDEQIAATLAAQTARAYENQLRFTALRNHAQMIEQELAERAKAVQQLRLYARRFETLHTIDRAILAAQSPQAIAQVALTPIRQLVPSRRASIIGFDFANREAEVWADESDSPADQRTGGRLGLDELPGLQAIRRGQLVAIDDLRAQTDRSRFQQQLLEQGLHTCMLVPILAQDDLIGCLAIASDRADILAPEHRDVVREVATQLAIAIHNLKLFEQVRIGRERLQRLSQQLVQAQESERRLIARELHDEIGQSLTAAQLNLQVMLGISDLAELPDRLEDSIQLIDRVLQQVRTLSLDLRPSMLDDLGLVPALRWYINRQAERAAFAAELRITGSLGQLAPELETTCFRIAQEGLNNIVRYARAKHVLVELSVQDRVLRLAIRDDGIGFDVGEALRRAAGGGSLGLVSMQERAVLVGGMIAFDSALQQGTTIDVRLPLEASHDAAQRIERRKIPR